MKQFVFYTTLIMLYVTGVSAAGQGSHAIPLPGFPETTIERTDLGTKSGLHHPADVNTDFRMTISEAIACLAAWQQGTGAMDYAIRAAYLWQHGEHYFHDYGQLPPLCWVPPGRRIQGMSCATWTSGACQEGESDQALQELVALGVSDIAVVPTWYQASLNSTEIYARPDSTITDEDVRHIVQYAHGLGLRVLLKPHLDPEQGGWRGLIECYNENDWQAWLQSYRNMVNHYAVIAEELGVELFCVGTELKKTSHRATDWRAIIDEVTEHFTGNITYGANWDELFNITWWDALDYIGVDAYYPLTNGYSPTVEELKAGWSGPFVALRDFSAQFGLPILFTEIGYCSYDGTNTQPYTWEMENAVVDLQEQADCYRAAYEVFWNEPWFAGLYWWNWDPNMSHGGPYDLHYSPRNKPAAAIIAEFYLP